MNKIGYKLCCKRFELMLSCSPMKLREVESKVLSRLSLQADISLSQLARLTKLKPHICRHAVESLFRRSLITRRVVINPLRVGYSIFGIWFSIKPRATRVHRQIIAHLINSPCVGYLGEFEGDYNYKIDILVRSSIEANAVLSEISEKFGDVFALRSLSCTVSITDFALKFLSPDQSQDAELTIAPTSEIIEVNQSDHEILRVLTAINNESHRSLAERLKIAPTTLEYRIKRLRERGVVIGYHILPEVEGMGNFGLKMHMHRIRLTQLDRNTRNRIAKFASQDNSVYGFTQSFGDFDCEICTVGDSTKSEREFKRRLESTLGDVIAEHTSVSILQHHKVNNYPFASVSSASLR